MTMYGKAWNATVVESKIVARKFGGQDYTRCGPWDWMVALGGTGKVGGIKAFGTIYKLQKME